MTTIGEALVSQLAERNVDCVFGIPGVHTIELYRGLASSGIRHVTPRHEQGAGFMADGYARASGKPGVAFVITGPGFTNTLTAMAQARADSIPMLVVSGVNTLPSLGKGLGHLHELPDQLGLSRSVSLLAERIEKPEDLTPALDKAFAIFASARPGPVHIELPMDVAGQEYHVDAKQAVNHHAPKSDPATVIQAARLLEIAKTPVILIGGGARFAENQIKWLAEYLDAPVIQTVNARGIMHAHPLTIPASPSLHAVRQLIEEADVVLAVGTEFGPTDYDMYATNTMPTIQNLIRIDICADQLSRYPANIQLKGDARDTLEALKAELTGKQKQTDGAKRAQYTREKALNEIGPDMRAINKLLNVIRNIIPNALLVGDSTQPIYAGNLYYDHDRPGGWFNASTGYGALGYGIPAAIGAAIAAPDTPVVCLVGDGGAQFSLPEIMSAVDEKLPIIFVVWNSNGYQEIETSMRAVDVAVVGCDPTPPDFAAVAASYRIGFLCCRPDPAEFSATLISAKETLGTSLIEVTAHYTPSV